MGDEWRVASGEWWVVGGGWCADPTSSELHHPPPLSIGWISDLFAKDELDAILGGIAGEAKNAGVPDLPQDRFNFLVKKMRSNFHVALAFSPVGDTFRIRARRFPGLINCTNIDYFHAWPEQVRWAGCIVSMRHK